MARRTNGTPLARVAHMLTTRARRAPRRLELRLPLTSSTDVAFALSLRVPRARRGHAGRRSAASLLAAAVYTLAVATPLVVVAAAPEIRQLSSLVFAPPAYGALWTPDERPRPFVRSRGSLVTAVSPDAPAVRAHVVAAGETLLSIAARYGIAPQTLAYNNGIANTADLRVGRSLVVPPLDAAIHVFREGETIAQIADRFGADPDEVRALNRLPFDSAAEEGRLVLLPVPDARYPGFRLRVNEAPRVLAPRVRWPTDGIITQLFSPGHAGVDIAAPHGAPIVASDAGTVSSVGWRGDGGLAVCIHHDWGLETCAYHASVVAVEPGERVTAGQVIARIGSTGVSTGPHVHWEARTNGVLVDPLTYAPATTTTTRVGGATGSP